MGTDEILLWEIVEREEKVPSAKPWGLLIYNSQCSSSPCRMTSILTKSLRSFSWGSRVTQLFSSLLAISSALSLFSSLWYWTFVNQFFFFLKLYPTLSLSYYSVLIYLILFWDSFSLSCALHVDVFRVLYLAFYLLNSNSSKTPIHDFT